MCNSKNEGYGYRYIQSSVDWFPAATRFNKGYQFGLNVELNQLVLGVEYEHDLSVFYTEKDDDVKFISGILSPSSSVSDFDINKQSLRSTGLLSDCCLYGCLD